MHSSASGLPFLRPSTKSERNSQLPPHTTLTVLRIPRAPHCHPLARSHPHHTSPSLSQHYVNRLIILLAHPRLPFSRIIHTPPSLTPSLTLPPPLPSHFIHLLTPSSVSQHTPPPHLSPCFCLAHFHITLRRTAPHALFPSQHYVNHLFFLFAHSHIPPSNHHSSLPRSLASTRPQRTPNSHHHPRPAEPTTQYR